MTVASVATTQRFNGNGSQTSFNFAYPYFANTDFVVYVGDTLQTLTTHYNITPTGSLSEGKYPGANIVFNTAPIAGSLNVKISRRVTAVQNTDISNITQLNTTDVETTLDKIVIIAQDSVDNANQVVDSAIDEAVAAAEAAIASDLVIATAAASTATTQAGIATAQASSASSSASIATTQASNASTSATLAGNYANYAEDNLVPGGLGYSSLHWRNKAEDQYLLAQQIVDSLDDLMAGAYLAYELRTASFTTVAGGRYFVDTSGLTGGTGITVSLFSTPSVLTECVITTNATDDRFVEFSNSPYPIEGYETVPLVVTKVAHIHLKFNPVNNKWIWINEFAAAERLRFLNTSVAINTADEIRPGDYVYCDTTPAAFQVPAPGGTKYPRPGDTFTVVDEKGTFASNNLTVVFNPRKLEGVVQNLVMSQNGMYMTFVYVDDTTGWKWKRSTGGKR